MQKLNQFEQEIYVLACFGRIWHFLKICYQRPEFSRHILVTQKFSGRNLASEFVIFCITIYLGRPFETDDLFCEDLLRRARTLIVCQPTKTTCLGGATYQECPNADANYDTQVSINLAFRSL